MQIDILGFRIRLSRVAADEKTREDVLSDLDKVTPALLAKPPKGFISGAPLCGYCGASTNHQSSCPLFALAKARRSIEAAE